MPTQNNTGTTFCRRFSQGEENYTVNYIATLVTIILSLFTCPAIIVMNVLVLVVIKTRHRLQSMYNMLLASLAGTDLFVGTIAQPTFIAVEVFAITGGSVATYCTVKSWITTRLLTLSILASLLHLVLLSVERLVAMKYALRYRELVTKFRLAIAVAVCWFLGGLVTLFQMFKVNPLNVITLPCLLILVILYSHITVYFITRRHQNQIKTEQISSEAAAKFLADKKAWKTTSIIIGFLFLAFLPGLLFNLGKNRLHYQTRNIIRHFIDIFLMSNSLCNPIIYCWRNKKIRKVIVALVKRQPQN